ncbi:MAG: twin-arginine translocase TatA/TatE family subunit [Deltaproteobacteria bacterium]|nr:twin-arginine translocase TatA/TatE family subunit [Deltaproteobacteria bacterium]
MFGLGTTELIVIGVIVFLIFGVKRIPEIGKGLGGAIREFRKVKKEISAEDDTTDRESPPNAKGGNAKPPPAIEDKLTEKVVEQIPGVRKAVDAKKKVDKVKEILKG